MAVSGPAERSQVRGQDVTCGTARWLCVCGRRSGRQPTGALPPADCVLVWPGPLPVWCSNCYRPVPLSRACFAVTPPCPRRSDQGSPRRSRDRPRLPCCVLNRWRLRLKLEVSTFWEWLKHSSQRIVRTARGPGREAALFEPLIWHRFSTPPLQIDDHQSERVPKTAVLWCNYHARTRYVQRRADAITFAGP